MKQLFLTICLALSLSTTITVQASTSSKEGFPTKGTIIASRNRNQSPEIVGYFGGERVSLPEIYHFTTAEFDDFAKKNIYHLDAEAYQKGKIKYKKMTPYLYSIKEELFTLHDDGDYLYLISIMSLAQKDAYVAKYGEYRWLLDCSVCRIKKSKGFDDFFSKHIAKLKIDNEVGFGLARAKSPFIIKYDASNDKLALIDLFTSAVYMGKDAENFICSGELSSTLKEREESIQRQKAKQQLINNAKNEWAYLAARNVVNAFKGKFAKRDCVIVYVGESRAHITDVYVLPPANGEKETDPKRIPPTLVSIGTEPNRIVGNFYHMTITEDNLEIHNRTDEYTLSTIKSMLKSKANFTSIEHYMVDEYRGVGTIGNNGYQPIK